MRGEGEKVKGCTSRTSRVALFSAELYLKALRTDFLPLLHPGDARFGLAHCLAHKRCHSSGNSRLIVGGLDEAGHAYQTEGDEKVNNL